MLRRAIHGGLIAWLSAVLPVMAAAVEIDGIGFFEQKIRPVLVKECYGCHSAGAKKVQRRPAARHAGGRARRGRFGPGARPGQARGEPLILEALRHEGLEMPPKSKLPDAVVADFERWITMGAPDPRDGQAVPVRSGIDLEAGRRFWSYQPVRRHTPPPVARADWPRTDIDRFLLAALEAREAPAGGRRRPRHAVAAAGLRPGGHAPDARGDRRLRGRSGPGRLRAAGRSPACFPAVRRALGPALARRGPLWRVADAPRLRLQGGVALPRLRHRRLQRRHAVTTSSSRSRLPATCFPRRASPRSDGSGSRPPSSSWATITSKSRTRRSSAWTSSTSSSTRSARPSWHRRSAARGATTTSSTRSRPGTTTRWPASSGTPRRWSTPTSPSGSICRCPSSPSAKPSSQRHETAVAALEGRIKQIRKEHGLVAAKGSVAADVAAGRRRRRFAGPEGRHVDGVARGRLLHRQPATSTTTTRPRGRATLTFQPELPEAATYEVRLAYNSSRNRCSAVPVTIFSADGETTVSVDMQAEPPIDGRFISLGRHRFERNGQGYVLVSNEGTKGTVVADAVQFLPVEGGRCGPHGEPRPASSEASIELRNLEAKLKRLKASRTEAGAGDVGGRGTEDRRRAGSHPRQRAQPGRAGAPRLSSGGDQRIRAAVARQRERPARARRLAHRPRTIR